MNNGKNIAIIVLVVLLVGLAGFLAFSMGKKPDITPVPLVVVAPPATVPPTTTPPAVTPPSTNALLVQAFAEKFSTDPKNITVTIKKEVAGFVEGGILLVEAGGKSGASFFAAKVNDNWVIAWDGHGTFACADLEKYNFPADFKKGCTPTVVAPTQPSAADVAGIKQAFAAKYKENLNVITVNITQRSGNFFRGTVHFSNTEVNSSAMFLAMKVAGTYDLIVDGHGTYLCSLVLPLGFPASMVTDCSK